MKNLTKKLLLPLALTTFVILNSNAQDFLPGKFKDYRKKPNDLVFSCDFRDSRNYYHGVFYDLDRDFVPDVGEIFLGYRNSKGKLKFSKNPLCYFLLLDPSKRPKVLIDSKMDGLNNNEEIYQFFDYEKFNL